MIEVIIKTESHYTVDRKRIREKIINLLKVKGVKGNAEIGINIVGDRLMRKLNSQYRQKEGTTAVLSFPMGESKKETFFIDPPDGVLRLGDIVISYPQARERASDDDMLVDDEIDELVEHGIKCLLGETNGAL